MEHETHLCVMPPLGLNQNIPLLSPTPNGPLLVPQNQLLGPLPTLHHQQFVPVFPPYQICRMTQPTLQQSFTAFPAPSINSGIPPQFGQSIHPIGNGIFLGHPIGCPSLQVGINENGSYHVPSDHIQLNNQMEPSQNNQKVGDQNPPALGSVFFYGPRTGVETDYLAVRQILGELTVGPPLCHQGPPPYTDAEIFVTNLPTDEFIQNKIYAVFSRIGAVYKIRVKINFSGSNKGYCFVHYYNWRDADRAIQELDGYKFYKTCCSGIMLQKSVNCKRLIVFGVPKHMGSKDVFRMVNAKQEFVDLIDIFCPSYGPGNGTQPSKNRGFCFMEFKTHMSAMFARKFMMRCPGQIFEGFTVSAYWAYPSASKGENNGFTNIGTSSSNTGKVQSNQS